MNKLGILSTILAELRARKLENTAKLESEELSEQEKEKILILITYYKEAAVKTQQAIQDEINSAFRDWRNENNESSSDDKYLGSDYTDFDTDSE